MKKIMENLRSYRFEDSFSSLKEKCLGFIQQHPEVFCISLLTISCLIFLFFGLWAYPLIDVDETRYAVMSRDLILNHQWNDLMLNGVPFLEKPPLYFWLVASSIKFFNSFSPWAVRFPIALLSGFLVFFTYYVGKRIISRKFGMISALVLLTSAFFLMLSHVAIIDMVLTVFMTSALYCALLTQFCEEKNKKYYWWYFYLFVGLGFLAKGILALAIPAVIVFLFALATKTAKEIFKPLYFIPGLIIFFVTIMPWHLIMYQDYGFEFIKQYFLVHHFGRFMGSEYIGRERPLLYFVPVFLLGFMPWTFIFLATVYKGCKNLINKFKSLEGRLADKLLEIVTPETNEQKLILFAVINFVVIFALFSSSSTKLPTYILPIFPAASFLTGYYWWISDEKAENEKSIYNMTILLSAIFILGALAATIVFCFLPYEIQTRFETVRILSVLALNLLAIFLIMRLSVKNALSLFGGYILIMLVIVVLAVSHIFGLVYEGGQNEIVDYTRVQSANSDDSQIVTFDFAVKPSVLVMGKRVTFITDPDFEALDEILQYKDGPTFVIVKNKNFADNIDYEKKLLKKLELYKRGNRYSLYVKDVNNEYPIKKAKMKK